MVRRIRQIVTIQPGGRIEVVDPDAPAGGTADVTVVITDSSPNGTRRLSEYLGSGRGIWPTSSDADSFLRNERDRCG